MEWKSNSGLFFFVFALTVLFSCTIPLNTANASDSVLVDVTVPSEFDVLLNADGTNTISEFKVQNNTILPVQIDNISASSVGGWELVHPDTEFVPDLKQISLSLEDNLLSAGENIVSNISFEPSQYHKTITSPNYPNNYPDNMTEAENYWEERFEGAYGILITFSKDAYLQEVYFDWLQIYDETGTSVHGKLAGKSFAGQTYMVKGDYVKIAMRSDAYWNYTGFSASITPIYSNEFNPTVTPSEKLLNWSVNRGLFTKDIANHKAFEFVLDFSVVQQDFHVAFDKNGSTDSISSITAKNGETIALPVITIADSIFLGWKDQTGAIYKDSFTMPVGGAILTAQWAHSPLLTTGKNFNATIPGEAEAVVFTDEKAPDGVEITDVSLHQNESVIGWLDGTTYKVSSQLSGVKVIANADSSYMFNESKELSRIDVKMLDVSATTNMNHMFYKAGYNTSEFEIDLTGWDTSAVNNMNYMLAESGHNASTWNVIGLSDLDISSVTSIGYMFQRAGYSVTEFNLDLSKWNTSSVTFMRNIFEEAGYNAPTFILNASSWDLSGVEDMGWILSYTARNSKNIHIDLSDWTTKKATSLDYAFSNVGTKADELYINVTNWQTDNMTSMHSIFYVAGTNAKAFEIDGLTTWDTSSATNMDNTFYQSGIREVDLSNWNTSNVTSMNGILASCKYLSKMVFGEHFSLVGVGNGWAFLTSPSSSYIPGANGKWYDQETGIAYTQGTIPSNVAATYVAVPPVLETDAPADELIENQ